MNVVEKLSEHTGINELFHTGIDENTLVLMKPTLVLMKATLALMKATLVLMKPTLVLMKKTHLVVNFHTGINFISTSVATVPDMKGGVM